MSDEAKDSVSRRGFLGMGSAALAAAGMLSAEAAAQEQKQYPTKSDRSASAPGPGNAQIDDQNPDSFLPPQTDAGGVQTTTDTVRLSAREIEVVRLYVGGMSISQIAEQLSRSVGKRLALDKSLQ